MIDELSVARQGGWFGAAHFKSDVLGRSATSLLEVARSHVSA